MKLNPTTILSLAIAATISFSASAQYKLPEIHKKEQSGLIAGQVNTKRQIKAQGNANYLNLILPGQNTSIEDIDVNESNWDSQSVNPYKDANVPDKKVIDVSDFAMPCNGHVTSPYGYRAQFGRMHRGVDLKASIGDTIYAAFDGKIRLTRFEKKGYGYYVVIRHSNELETIYGHLSRFLVKPNQSVKAGDPIALSGNTGRSTGPHLHFETRFMGYAINPAAIFDFDNKTVHTDYYTFNKSTYQDARDFSPNANKTVAEHRTAPVKSKAAAASQKAAKKVKVKKGDSLASIAHRHGTTVDKLCRANGISKKAKLKAGQTLKVG